MRNDFETGINKVLDVLSIELLNRKTTKFDEFASRFVKEAQSIKPTGLAKGFEPNFETGIDVAFEVMLNIITDMEPSGNGDTWKLALSIMKQVKHL